MENEVWKDIPYYENEYQISNYGRVKSKSRIINYKNINRISYNYQIKERILKPRIDKKGYIHYALNKNGITKEYKAHRLVALVFVPNPYNKSQINHKDMNKQNNYVDNLEWCTNGENQKHSYKNNLNRKNFFKTNNPKKKIVIE